MKLSGGDSAGTAEADARVAPRAHATTAIAKRRRAASATKAKHRKSPHPNSSERIAFQLLIATLRAADPKFTAEQAHRRALRLVRSLSVLALGNGADGDAAPEASDLVSIPEAARRLNICRQLVYGLLNRGKLQGVHIGRRHLIKLVSVKTLAGVT